MGWTLRLVNIVGNGDDLPPVSWKAAGTFGGVLCIFCSRSDPRRGMRTSTEPRSCGLPFVLRSLDGRESREVLRICLTLIGVVSLLRESSPATQSLDSESLSTLASGLPDSGRWR